MLEQRVLRLTDSVAEPEEAQLQIARHGRQYAEHAVGWDYRQLPTTGSRSASRSINRHLPFEYKGSHDGDDIDSGWLVRWCV